MVFIVVIGICANFPQKIAIHFGPIRCETFHLWRRFFAEFLPFFSHSARNAKLSTISPTILSDCVPIAVDMGETGTSTPPSCVYRFTKRQTHRGYISRGFWQLTPSFRSAECVEAVCVLLFSSWLFWMADRDIPHIFFGIGGQTRNYVMRQNDPNWKQINIHAVSVSVCFVRRAAFGGWFVFVLVFILPIMNRVGAFSRITFFSLCARQVLRSINKYRTHATARFIDKFCAHCNLRVFGHMII